MPQRLLGLTLAVAALTAAVAGCGGSSASGGIGGASSTSNSSGSTFTPPVASNPHFAPDTTMSRLAKQGTIIVGTKYDAPLFGLQGLNGQLTGFDVNLAKIISGALGISADHIHWVETPSDVRDQYVESGRANMVIATYDITPERQKHITFAGPYYDAESHLMVLSSNKTITGPSSLKYGKVKVCTVTGAADVQALMPYLASSNQLVEFDVFSKCADALKAGQVDAVGADSATLLGLASQSHGAFKVVGPGYLKQPLGIGIKKGDVSFCDFIDTTLRHAAKDGVYAKAWQASAGTVEHAVPTMPTFIKCQ